MKQTTTKTDSFFSGFLGFFFSRLSSLTSKGIDQLRKKGDQQTTATDPQIVLAVFGHLAVILSATGCFFGGGKIQQAVGIFTQVVDVKIFFGQVAV